MLPAQACEDDEEERQGVGPEGPHRVDASEAAPERPQRAGQRSRDLPGCDEALVVGELDEADLGWQRVVAAAVRDVPRAREHDRLVELTSDFLREPEERAVRGSGASRGGLPSTIRNGPSW